VPTLIVPITPFVAVLITETVFEPLFITYALLPSGLTHASSGSDSTPTVATTVFVVVLITDTVPSPEFVMYANPANSGVAVMVSATGVVPVFIAVNEAILPTPFAARPMAVVLPAQVNVFAVPVKLTGAVTDPFATVWLGTVFTEGVAFTTPATATVSFVAPVEVNITLPDISPAAAVAAERTYTTILSTVPPDCGIVTLPP
jgi:hypothetical protein